MPIGRRLGNAALSLICKCSTVYWDLLDPTNGFTAISRAALEALALDRLSRRYFFETDMLFRLHVAHAVVLDTPMDAVYGEERSGIRIWRIGPEFLVKNLAIACKRLIYEYLYYDFNPGTVQLLGGTLLLGFGVLFGSITWLANARQGVLTPAGTIMLAGLPTILGFQLLLSFLNYDIAAIPRRPLSQRG
jgi:dolichol-phosphate mannosyltransferase